MLISSHPEASVTIDGHKVPCKELVIDLSPYHEGEFVFRKFKSSVILVYRDLSYPYTKRMVKRFTEWFDIEEVMELQFRKINFRYTEQDLKEIAKQFKNLK